jgi:hypothetical protein
MGMDLKRTRSLLRLRRVYLPNTPQDGDDDDDGEIFLLFYYPQYFTIFSPTPLYDFIVSLALLYV